VAKAPPLAARPTIWTPVPESGKSFTHCHHVFRKTDTACTQSKMGVASYFSFKENRHSTDMDRERDNVVYWKTNTKIINDLQGLDTTWTRRV